MATRNGWKWNPGSAQLELYALGTLVGTFTATAFNPAVALGVTGTVTGSTGVVATTGGVTATAGGVTATAGDVACTAGNVKIGAVSAFGTTEPVSAVTMKVGTAPAGAVTTSGGIFIKQSDGSVVQKIIAAGTVSNVET